MQRVRAEAETHTERRRGRSWERLENRLTDGDCSYHWRHNDRECHPTSNHQVPLVVGNIFALIAVMDLTETKGPITVT